MKKILLLSFCVGISGLVIPGCADDSPTAIEQTMTPEEIAAEDARYEAEMEAAENDTDGE